MQLAAARIFTDDVDALVAFYEKATGIASVRLFPLFAELRTPTGTIAIASTETLQAIGGGVAEARANRSIVLDFRVDDVDATDAALRNAGITPEAGPSDMPWGNRSLLVRDPDGTLINFFAPITEDARKRFAGADAA